MRATRHPRPRFTPRAAALLTSAVLICTPALPLVAAVQDAPARAGQSIRREVNLVLVEATVKDKRGQVIGDLKQEDFRVTDNGQPQQIAHFSRDQLPLAVALVVDLSGSIQPFLRPLRYASMSALKALKPEDEVALITFSGEPELLVELTREKAEVADPFEDIQAEGGTNINDAVFEAANYLRDTAPAARRIIVLVSDNVPTVAGRVDHQEVVDAALKADAAVYGLKIPGRNPRGLNIVTGRSFRGLVNVKKLTEDTGGEIFDIEKEGSLFLAFQALIERLKTRYTLGYYPGSEARDADFHRLEVALGASRGAKDRDYTILAKTGYYPPAGRRPSR